MTTKVEQGYQYTATHEWVRVEGSRAFVGVTDFAQHAMGNVVYVELPEAGKALQAGEDFCVVESVKAAADVYMPVTGTITEVNEALRADPSLANSDPLGNGWFFKILIKDMAEFDVLMDEPAYEKFSKNA